MHLTEDEALLVETVTKLMSDEVKPFARGWETTGIPNELWTTLGELGLLAITTPESKGGAGLGLRDLGLVVGHLAQGDLGLAWALARHNQALAVLAESPFQNIAPYLTGQLQIDWSRRSTLNASQGAIAYWSLKMNRLSFDTAAAWPRPNGSLVAGLLGTQN